MPATKSQYTVFEAINKSRKEIFIGVTRSPVFETVAELRHARSRPVADWDPEDRVIVRSLEFGLSLKQAKLLVSGYTHSKPPKGWRYRK
jgi:hypothetical protein